MGILKSFKDKANRFMGKIKQARGEPAQPKSQIKEEAEQLTYQQAKRIRSAKRFRAHEKYTRTKSLSSHTPSDTIPRKFRVRSMQRFLPKVRVKGQKIKLSCRAFIVNHQDRDHKASGLKFNPTGAAARKRQQRAMQRGVDTPVFTWPDGGRAIRASLDYHLTRAGQ